MNEGFISINRIIDDIYDNPLLRDTSIDRIINYTFELMRILGCPQLFIDKVSPIEIKDNRGLLPCDFIYPNQVKGKHDEEFVSATDNFLGYNEGIGTHSYKIQGKVIITSLKEGTIFISYRAAVVDENGFPMIPDNAEFIRAIEYYIKAERYKILADQGKINERVLERAERDYCFYIGQANTNFSLPTEDEMETLTNIWHNLIPKMREHRSGFASMHNKEYIKRH